jgi:hypothetical protein
MSLNAKAFIESCKLIWQDNMDQKTNNIMKWIKFITWGHIPCFTKESMIYKQGCGIWGIKILHYSVNKFALNTIGSIADSSGPIFALYLKVVDYAK